MNVVIYARYSSHNQNETSIEGQLKVCYEYARQHEFTVVGEYIDRAISGTTDNREQFQKMLKDSEKGEFQGVLLYQLDRFGRNDLECAINEDKLNKNGVEVYSAKENFSKDPSGRLLKGVIRSVNQYYSDELSVKVSRGMDLNAGKFYYNGGTVPLGLKVEVVEELNGPFNKKIEKKKFAIDEEKAPIVQKIFDMYINGHTMFDIIRYLNKLEIKTSLGNEFNKNSIRTILLNKKYIGVYSYRGEETPNVIPRIIDDETFKKAHERLLKNKEAPARARAKTNYLLTTKLFCGNCKEMMVGVSGTSQDGTLHCYYGCKGNLKKKCKKKNVQKDYIENAVIEKAKEILTDEKIEEIANAVYKTAYETQDHSKIKQLQRDFIKLNKKKNNLVDSLTECDTPELRKAIFDKMKALEEHTNELERQIKLEESSQFNFTIPQIREFLKSLKYSNKNDTKYKQMILNILVYKVYLYDKDITIIFNIKNQNGDMLEKSIPNISEIEKSLNEQENCSYKGNMVGATGFEPATPWSQTTCATNCATPR